MVRLSTKRRDRITTTASPAATNKQTITSVAQNPRNMKFVSARAVLTDEGKAMTDKIDTARERLSREISETWEDEDIADPVRLMCRFAKAFSDGSKGDR